MNLHFIIANSLFLIALFDGALAFLLIKNNPLNKNLNRAVAMMALPAGLFALFAGIVYVRDFMGLNYDFYYRACWVGWLAIPATFQCSEYVKDDKSPKAFTIGVWLYAFWLTILGLCFITNWFEIGAPSLFPFVHHYGPLKEPVRWVAGAMILWVIFRLFRISKEVTGIQKAQLNYFTLGILLYGLSSVICQIFERYGFDPAFISYGSFPFVALTFYSITRYRLFDIQIIISNSLVIVLLTMILGTINILLFKLLEPHVGPTWAILSSLFVIIIIFLRTPLRHFVQGGINDIFIGDKYNYQEMLKESSQAIVTMLDQDELLNFLIHAIQQSFKIRKASLFLKTGEAAPYTINNSWGYDKGIISQFQISSDNFIDWIIDKKKIFIKEEQQGLMSLENFNRLYGNLGEIEAELVLPLVFKDNLIGFFIFGPKDDHRPYIQSDINILQTLASQAAIAIENARLYSEAITDSMTRLYHHKYFMMRLKEEMNRSKRYGHPMNLLMIDIDNFKSINDICGHLAGDKVLVGVAHFIKNKVRITDIVGRYGGDEFAVIVTATDHKGAMLLAGRLREGLEQTSFEGNIKLTISVGVCSFDTSAKEMTTEELIDTADKTLYLAKKNGRNRIESA